MKVPPGYKLVPIEPTAAMLDAAKNINTDHAEDDPIWALADVYRAMVQAAPQVTSGVASASKASDGAVTKEWP